MKFLSPSRLTDYFNCIHDGNILSDTKTYNFTISLNYSTLKHITQFMMLYNLSTDLVLFIETQSS